MTAFEVIWPVPQFEMYLKNTHWEKQLWKYPGGADFQWWQCYNHSNSNSALSESAAEQMILSNTQYLS